MGMSAGVEFYRKPDERYEKMLEVYRACKDADMDLPDEVEQYFDDEDEEYPLLVECDAAKEWSNEYSEGYEVDVDKLPKTVKKIRFVMSW